MSDVKNLYTLKKPVSIEDYDGGDLVEVDGHILLQSEIKELFVPLDVESLTTQVETIIEKIEKILTEYCTARSFPIQTINIEGKISKRKFRKLKKQWIEAQK